MLTREPAGLAPLELCGVRTTPSRLFKLRGHVGRNVATFMLDSGASSDFMDPDFARACGLVPTPSSRTIRLADGSIVAASGEVTVSYTLTSAGKGAAPVAFSSTFTVTPLQGYDAILGMSWLDEHDPEIGWRERSLTTRTTGRSPALFRPLDAGNQHTTLATLTMNGVRKAIARDEVDELYALFVRPAGSADAAAPPPPPVVPPTPKEQALADALLREYADVFGAEPNGVPPSRGVEHRIVLVPGAVPPPVRPLRHQSSKDLAFFEEYTRELVAAGKMQLSNSPFGAMALIVRKKDGTSRVVIDYRDLNELTVKNKYPLPLMDELFDRVTGAQYFTKLDLKGGFHQILIHEDDRAKTAFRTRYGSYEYRVLPMGLCNAPGTFMELMNSVFRDMLDRSVLVFLDDILVFSKTLEEHVTHLREVLDRLRAQKLYAKLSKCELIRRMVTFLGHLLGVDGLRVMADKVGAVREWPTPRSATDVRAFLGLAGFYRRFVKDFSLVALPLSDLTKDKVAFAWSAAAQSAFDALKRALCSAPVLLIADPTKPYTLNTDACDFAIGATLQQDHGNGLQPVAFMSRKLKDAEINYDTREKEALALVSACKHWRQYLHSELPFTLLSDHDSLKYFKTMPLVAGKGRIARWIDDMSEFKYTIAHIPGKDNIVADALSRRADYKDAAPVTESLAPIRVRPPDEPPLVVAARRERDRASAEVSEAPAAGLPAPKANGTVVMPSQRCTATARTGNQCRSRTARGQFCWNHLRSISGLQLKKSAIPNAGLGLHAARALPADTRIDYTGDRVPLESERDGGVYFLELTVDSAIDAARTNAGYGRWVNDPKGSGRSANAEFVLYTPPGMSRIACVKTTRAIAVGEEIVVPYGGAYWRFHAAQLKLKLKRRNGAAPRKAARVVWARKRGRPVGAGDAALALAAISQTSITSALLDSLRAAAAADSEYAAQLTTPPAGITAHDGLLWAGSLLRVPTGTALRTRILAECHDAVTGAHFGRDKTLAALKSRFEWAGMATDAERYVSTCDACQRNKPSQQLTPGALMPLPLPERVGAEWTTDAVTGLPKTKRGHDAIQVYVERLCKLKHFVASRSTDGAVEMARSLTHAVIRPHGVPEVIVSDRDPRFTATFYKEFTKLIGADLRMSTARHPQTDGQSEREIKTLITALRAFCNDHQDDWDDYLDLLELGFNSAVQASTQRTPFEMLYGMQPRLPIDVALASAPRNPAAVDRATRMRAAVEYAREHLLTAQERQIRNASRRPASLSVGDLVLLSTDGLTLRDFGNKLCARYVGPFAVTAAVNANAYTLALPPQLSALHPTFNVDKLKLYRSGAAAFPDRPAPFARPPPVADADSNGDAQWEVERITAQRKRGRGHEYLVSWVGYPAEENEWRTRADLAGSPRALAEWDALQKA